MTALPILVRELRLSAGGRYQHFVRVLAAGLGIAVVGWLAMVDSSGAVALDGRRVLQLLGWAAFGFCLIAGGVTTANSIGHERREGTLGLLFLTDLKGRDVVLGKLAVASLPLIGGVVGFLPLLSFSLLLGGVNPMDVVLMSAVLGNTLFLSLSLGLLVSAISRHESRALTASVLLPMAVAFGPYVVGQLLYGAEDREPFQQLPGELLSVSPAHALALVFPDAGSLFQPVAFWTTMAIVHASAWASLGAAGLCLLRLVRENVPPPWLDTLQRRVQALVFGDGDKRLRRRRELLGLNPIVWLSSRHRHKDAYLWLFVASLGLIAVGSGLQTQGIWFEWKPAVGFLLITHAAMKLCFVSEACHRLGMDREHGGFELILTTPTTVETVARGHGTGLRRLFAGPLVALFLLDASWLVMDWQRPDPDHDRWVMVWILAVVWVGMVVDLFALRWVSLWQTLAARTAARAAQACVLRVQLVPFLVFLGAGFPLGWFGRSFASARGRESVVVGLLGLAWLVIGLVNAWGWGAWSRYVFLKRCQAVASEGESAVRGAWRRALEEWAGTLRERWREPFTVRFWVRHPAWTVFVGIAVVGAGILAMRQWRLESQLNQEVLAMGRYGIPVAPGALERWQPRVADASNAVVQFRLAMEQLNVPQGIRLEPVLLPGRLSALTPRLRAGYVSLIQTNRPAVEAAKRAMEMPEAWFDPNAHFAFIPGRFRGSLPLRLSGMILAETALAIEDGETEAAVGGILEILQFAEFVGRQPRCSGQNVRHATIHQALDGLERLMARRRLTAAQLGRMRAAFESAHGDRLLNRALQGELWLVLQAWEQQRFTLANFNQSPLQRVDFPEALRLTFGRWSGMAGREYSVLLGSAERIVESRQINEVQQVELAAQWRDAPGPVGYYYSDGQQWLQNVGGTLSSYWVCQARLRAALQALELELAGNEQQSGGSGSVGMGAGSGSVRWLDPYTGRPFRVAQRDSGFGVMSAGVHGEDVTWVNRFTGREPDEEIRFVIDRLYR